MSHQIETSGQEAAFYSARVTPWHGLGTVTDEAKDAREALQIAHLDWEVTKQPLTTTYITDDGVSLLTVPDKFATVRVNPFNGQPEVLGVVGKDYTVVQNDANADFLDALVQESGAHFETAGSLRGGRQVFVSIKAPEAMLIGGEDAVDQYLVATNSHDGTKAWQIAVTPTRVVCANTLRAGLRNARATWSSRHTKNATDRVAEAQEALGIMWDYAKVFEAEANKMADANLSQAQFERIVAGLDLFAEPKNETERQERDRVARLEEVFKVYETSPTNATIKGTRWGGYNAVTEYLDWQFPVRGKDQSVARLERIATGGWLDKAKQDAFEAFKVAARK